MHGLQKNIILELCRDWSEMILIPTTTRTQSDSKTTFQEMKVGELDQSLSGMLLISRLGHLYIRVHNMISLELALQRFGVMTDGADGINLVNFLRSMLRLKPSDRASAGELLGHKWLSS